MKYSVLMSVYKEEKPIFLKSAINSIMTQTIKTDDFVIVWDGPLTKELEDVLEYYKMNYPEIFRYLKLDQNMGLGHALNKGVLHCKHSLIARMDSDDVSVPQRIEWQLNIFEKYQNLVLCGGQIEEFSDDPEIVVSTRMVPYGYKDIYSYSKRRNPFNHMTVMFKKEAVIEAGNYLSMKQAEDYYLWVRMLQKGFAVRNLKHVLVKVRVGNGMFQRRGGFCYAKNMLKLMLTFYQSGFLNRRELISNVMVRSVISLLPSAIRQVIYQKGLRK